MTTIESPDTGRIRMALDRRATATHTMSTTRVLLLGAGFIAEIHAESYQRFVPDAELVGVYSRSEPHARAFADRSTGSRGGSPGSTKRSPSRIATSWTSACPTTCTRG